MVAATALLGRLIGYANDLGLFAEVYDLVSGRPAGKFPQLFSHLKFIRAVDAVTGAKAQPWHGGRPRGVERNRLWPAPSGLAPA